MEELTKNILKRVFKDETKSNIKIVSDVLLLNTDNNTRANLICEHLDIEKRENRWNIRTYLDNQGIN